MTKKHFEVIADALNQTKPQNTNKKLQKVLEEQWRKDVDALVPVLAAGNPNFNLGKFIDRCIGRNL